MCSPPLLPASGTGGPTGSAEPRPDFSAGWGLQWKNGGQILVGRGELARGGLGWVNATL